MLVKFRSRITDCFRIHIKNYMKCLEIHLVVFVLVLCVNKVLPVIGGSSGRSVLLYPLHLIISVKVKLVKFKRILQFPPPISNGCFK